MKRVRHYIFLKDVLLLTLTAFGGPQAHIALLMKVFVKKRGYLTEEELMDLYSFCQMLPGPASTQTITAIGFRMGGPKLAFLTLLVWILPAVTIMTAAAIFISSQHSWLNYTKYVQVAAVGFVIFAAWRMAYMAVCSKTSLLVLILSAVACYFVPNPVIFPLILLAGGALTSFKYRAHPLEEKKEKLKVEWSNLILFLSIFFGAAILGHFTRKLSSTLPISLSIRLFENCFRNGALTFGGGEALIALFNKEFVVMKHYLTNEEFLSGYGLLKSLPGPLFSFSSYIGALSMKNYGTGWQVVGSIMTAAGIFLPGTILIFFVIRFWDQLKKYRVVKASLEGVNAASAGIVTSTSLILFQPLTFGPTEITIQNILIISATFLLLVFTKIPSSAIILICIVAGIIF